MASESVTDSREVRYSIDEADVRRIQWMLLDAIRATNELNLLCKSIQFVVDKGMEASTLLLPSMKPEPIDLEITEAAGMVQFLSVLTPAPQEARP